MKIFKGALFKALFFIDFRRKRTPHGNLVAIIIQLNIR